MDSDALKPNARDLQRDVVDLLEQIGALMGQASTALSSDSASEKYASFQREVENEHGKVEKLELRMAVVAPMKAGKSTIINAVIGQELLPSHNAAMTTLPTEVVFDTELPEPILTLSGNVLTIFNKTLERLQHKIGDRGIDWARKKTAHYPQLVELLERIAVGFSITSETKGFKQINKTLKDLNHIVRLHNALAPEDADPLQNLSKILRIQTPFRHTQTTEQPKIPGKLVIVDTPGPNEAGNLKLGAVVSQELEKSSMVLIVLDFTKLRDEAAEKVKQEVKKVIEIRSKENLYILINRIDLRKDGDMDSAQVKQFVTAEFDLDDSGDTDRVFEVAALWALQVANLRQALEQNKDVPLAKLEAARAIAPAAFGAEWEEDLEEAEVKELQRKAERLWKKSKFSSFIEEAVKALMERAAPECMKSALIIGRSRLVELRNEVKLKRVTIAEEAGKIQKEIAELERDLSALEECRGDFLQQEVDRLKENLRRELNAELKNLQKQIQVSIDKFFWQEEHQRYEDEYQRANPVGKLAIIGAASTKRIVNFIQQKDYEYANVIEFDSAEEAKEFLDLAVVYVREKVDNLLEVVRRPVEDRVKQASLQIIAQLEKKTRPIIEGARQRLNKTFNIDLEELPLLFLGGDRDRLTGEFQFNCERKIREKTEYQNLKVRVMIPTLWWTWDWVEIETPFKIPVISQEEYYTISVAELAFGVNKSIEESIENIYQRINEYLDEEFQQRVDTLFKNLNNHLSSDKDILVQSLNNKNLSLAQQEELKLLFISLEQKATQQIDDAGVYLGRID